MRVVRRQDDHHRQLAAQEFGEDFVDLLDDGARLAAPVPRHQLAQAVADHLPVAQQVEHHDRNQREVDQDRHDDEAAGLDAGQHPQRKLVGGLDVLGDERPQRVEVERDRHAEALLQPGRDFGGSPAPRRSGSRFAARPTSAWTSGTRTRKTAMQRETEQRITIVVATARGTSCGLRGLDDRRAEIGQDRSDQEGRQHPSQPVQRQYDGERGSDDPQVVARRQRQPRPGRRGSVTRRCSARMRLHVPHPARGRGRNRAGAGRSFPVKFGGHAWRDCNARGERKVGIVVVRAPFRRDLPRTSPCSPSPPRPSIAVFFTTSRTFPCPQPNPRRASPIAMPAWTSTPATR